MASPEFIPYQQLETGQEDIYGGGTPVYPNELYTPSMLLSLPRRKVFIDEVQELREEIGWSRSPLMRVAFIAEGVILPGEDYGVRLQPLNARGQTVEDPQVFSGKWNKTGMVFTPESDITGRVNRYMAGKGIELHLRGATGTPSNLPRNIRRV